MRSPARVLLALAIAVLATLAATGAGTPARAATDTELVYGRIAFPQHDSPNLKMLWFDQAWHYLGQQRADGGGYSIRLAPGTYHLQFVDQRQPWITTKYAPTDVQVTVGHHPVDKAVTMKRGAAITGTARAQGRPLAGARVVAANKAEQSFVTQANAKGQFAIGGLPQGQYCLFTYDRAKRAVDKCTWAGSVDPGQVQDQQVDLGKSAGSLTVFLETAGGSNAPRSSVTVTSLTTGQWWTATARSGKAVFAGLYPGQYTITYDGAGPWLTQSGAVHGGTVRANTMAFGDFTLTERGASVTGTVLDGGASGPYVLKGAQVLLLGEAGQKLAEATSDASGVFHLVGQITTQAVTLVVNPNPYQGGYMQGESYCVFQRTVVPGSWQVTTGRDELVGDIHLDRAPDGDQPSDICRQG